MSFDATATIVAVQEDIVRLRLVDPAKGRLMKNEVIYIRPAREPEQRLKAEVLRVIGDEADAQVYESTAGIGLGDGVEQTGRLLSVRLGPGLLGQVYDGLQNPLEALAQGAWPVPAQGGRRPRPEARHQMGVYRPPQDRRPGARRRHAGHGSGRPDPP